MARTALTFISLSVACFVLAGCNAEPSTDSVPEAVDVASANVVTDEPINASPSPSASLGIGDPAPEIRIAQWVHGEAVDPTLEGGVHVVEFWATWCGPCLANMPHLSDLQEQYSEDVTFVGVTREDAFTVQQFLGSPSADGQTWKETLKYRLAVDNSDLTNLAYMRAANRSGIPCAFIVGNEGIVEWIGHPAEIDEPLQRVVDGTWDRDEAIAQQKEQERLQQLSNQLSTYAQMQKWDKALETLDELEAGLGANPGITQTRIALLTRAGRLEEAAKLREELVDMMWEDPMALNAIAAEMVSGENPTTGLDLALRAAERSAELSEYEQAAALNTLARVHFVRGNIDEAINWQRKALEKNETHPGIRATLDQYLEAKEGSGEEEATDE